MTKYLGDDVLENLETAKNYNNALASKVKGELCGPDVLDFGAGSGTFAQLIQEDRWQVSCLEADQGYVKKLRAAGFISGSSFETFGETAFSDVYSLNVLEHIEEDVVALREIREHMAIGGRLVLFVPAHPVLYSSFDKRIGHFRRYTKSDLIRKVEQSGFQVTKCEYFDSLGYFVALLYRIIDRGRGRLPGTAVRFFDSAVFPASRLLDKVLKKVVGKNLFLVAHRAEDSEAQAG